MLVDNVSLFGGGVFWKNRNKAQLEWVQIQCGKEGTALGGMGQKTALRDKAL